MYNSIDDAPRRRKLRALDEHGIGEYLNGIDYAEVNDDGKILTLVLFGDLKSAGLVDEKGDLKISKDQIRLEGAQSVEVESVKPEYHNYAPDRLIVTLKVPPAESDLSTYTVRLVKDKRSETSPRGIDQQFSQASFAFHIATVMDTDCAVEAPCPLVALDEPYIDYLTKDYSSFRQLMLDRLSLTMQEWKERRVPDIMIALIETLAYTGDYLSYYQDAAATEAYLDTARLRSSVRRHTRLVDYRMHEGYNARTWIHLHVSQDVEVELKPNQSMAIPPIAFMINPYPDRDITTIRRDELEGLNASDYVLFEPVWESLQDGQIKLFEKHNEIYFYNYGEREYCLPRGATSAAVIDNGLNLKQGDVLFFEEVKGPATGKPTDYDPSHRHIIRIIDSHQVEDKLYGVQILEISWGKSDALPFPLCLSTFTDNCGHVDNVSVARGNMILVDHGQTLPGECLEEVPYRQSNPKCDPCSEESPKIALRFRPSLKEASMTFAQRPLDTSSASAMLEQDAREALPQIRLVDNNVSEPEERFWEPRYDLLGSDSNDRHFVVEMSDNRHATLRFGDGKIGLEPPPGHRLMAHYRAGNGTTGHIGAEALTVIVRRDNILPEITKARNPFAIDTGCDPEPVSEVRLCAPSAFRKWQNRAVIPADYAQLAKEHFSDQVQRAAAELRWFGSRYEVQVLVDQYGQIPADRNLLREVESYLRPFARIGHDVRAVSAVYVPLDITVTVGLRDGYLRGDVLLALREHFSTRSLSNGTRGYFHPDNLSFGDRIALSQIIAVAQAVPGVERVERLVIKAKNQNYEWPDTTPKDPTDRALSDPVIKLLPLEIAVLDKEVKFVLRGGR